MTSKTIDVATVEAKFNYHKAEMEKWATVLEAIKELDDTSNPSKLIKVAANNSSKSASARAIEIAKEILESGEMVTSVEPFLKKINQEGVKTRTGGELSASSLSSILGQSGIIKYNRETRTWELIK